MVESVLKREAESLLLAALASVFDICQEKETSSKEPSQKEASPKDTSLSSQMVYPPEIKLGHVAYPCHSLSKKLRKAPQPIATQLAEAMNAAIQSGKSGTSGFTRVDAVNGYLNCFADLDHLFSRLKKNLHQNDSQEPQKSKKPKIAGFPDLKMLEQTPEPPQKIMVEYAQLNTHKAYHVGHLRNIVLGDGVARLVQASGNQVVRTVYPGDLGTHIAKSPLVHPRI